MAMLYVYHPIVYAINIWDIYIRAIYRQFRSFCVKLRLPARRT